MALTLSTQFIPHPVTERGRPNVLTYDAKKDRIAYANGNTVILRSLQNPEDVLLYTQHRCAVSCATVSPSGCYCASGDVQGNVRIWATDNADLTIKLETKPLSKAVKDISWCGESQRVLAVGDGSGSFAQVFLFDTGATIGTIAGHSKVLNSCDMRKQRPWRAITGGDDMQVVFHKGPPFEVGGTCTDHTNYVNTVRFSPDGALAVSISSDKKIILYEGKTGEKVGDIPCDHKGSIYACSWTPDSKMILTSSADKTCKLWDVTDRKLICTFPVGDPKIVENMQVSCIAGANAMLSLSLGGDFNFLDPASPDAPVRILRGHSKPVTGVAYDAPSNTLLSVSNDGMLLRWRLGAGPESVYAERVKGKPHGSLVTDVTIEGGSILTCGMDDLVARVDAASFQYTGEKAAVRGGATACEAIPGQPTVVVLTGGAIYVVHEGAVVQEIKVPWTPTSISATTGMVAVGGKDNAVHIYTVEGNRLQESKSLPQISAVTAVAFSKSGAKLALVDSGRQIQVLKVAEDFAVEKDNLVYHSAVVRSLSFSNDEAYLASGGLDVTVVVVNLETRATQTARAHNGGVNRVLFLEDNRVASCGVDAFVRVWTHSL